MAEKEEDGGSKQAHMVGVGLRVFSFIYRDERCVWKSVLRIAKLRTFYLLRYTYD